MIYLASPYSHPCLAVRIHRFEQAAKAAAYLCRQWRIVFCPIVSSHPLVKYGLSSDWDFWEMFDREFISRCDELWVLKITGWEESKGVQAEMKIAKEMGKPISFLEWSEVDQVDVTPY